MKQQEPLMELKLTTVISG